MNVGELKKALEQHPDDMDVVVSVYSDYGIVGALEVIKAVDQGGYVMSSHSTMSAENKAKERSFLYIGACDA